MPPKAKYTKNEIVRNALELVREQGIERLTARDLGEYLNCSSRPIFTAFANMDELKSEVKKAAEECYQNYIEAALNKKEVVFKDIGKVYIRFACDEKNLFKLLFMTEAVENISVNNVLPDLEGKYQMILEGIAKQFEISKEQAAKMYRHLWIYTHGIAVLMVTNVCTISDEEIDNCLYEVGKSIITIIRMGEI